MNISHAKVLLWDRGDSTFLAEAFAEKAAEVWHYTPILGRQPKIKEELIGSGYEGVEKIDNFEEYVDKADLIVFPGEFDGEVCNRMWEEGRRAFGSGMSADLEIDRILFLDTLKKVGLPIIKTYRAEGLDDAEDYLRKHDNKRHWIKLPFLRGEFDTEKFDSMKTFKPWFDLQRSKLGVGGSATVELLIQDDFPAVVESGGDRYIIDGKRTTKGSIGYEKKDSWYIYKVVPEFPKILDDIDAKMESEFKRLGYRGAYSTEVRINKKGEARYTDICARFGSPPGECLTETYETFAQDVFDVANGDMPKMKEVAPYGAMIVLVSDWNEKQEICVEFPKEIKNNVKLRHSYIHEGNYYCIPNESYGYFGAVVSQGKTMKEAIDKANEYAEQIVCLGLEYTKISYDEAAKLLKGGKSFDINVG